MKRIRNNFFLKTFSISLLMLFSITAIAYLLLYLLLPVFYEQYKLKEYDKKIPPLISVLEDSANESEELDFLSDFASTDNADIIVLREDESVLFQAAANIEFSVIQSSDEELILPGKVVEVTDSTESGKNYKKISSYFEYTSKGKIRYLQVDIPLQPLDEAKSVIINIYPLAGLLCIVFSFILAMLFSRNVVKPIRIIQHTLKDMSQLKSDAYIKLNRNDEIAEMGQDINKLYEELRNTIVDLEQRIGDYSNSENQKIDFLRNVSHELKSPLASANALIEGIIYEISPYCDNKEKYLNECRDFLQKAILLTKESLSLSPVCKEVPKKLDLKQVIETEFRPYKVILRSRQVKYSVDIPENITFETSHSLFTKAVSNILSNAANYTKANGCVKIRYSQNCLHIDNTCKPLSEEELRWVMKPMYSGKNKNRFSNGLGLYIVRQSLDFLKMPFSFTPTEENDGMRFTIQLKAN